MGEIVTPGGDLSNNTKKALKNFQAFAGINETGVLDKKTMDLMKRPRCGVKDIFRETARLYFTFSIIELPQL